MEITPFGNTLGFGSLVRTLRVKAGLSFEATDKRGGPSDRYQKDIESGASMPITAETITKYIAAFTSTGIGVNASFLNAVAAVHRAAESEPQDIAGAPMPSRSRGFLLGSRLDGGDDLCAAAVSYPGEGIALELAAQGAEYEFLEAAGRIAARHKELTLVPWRFALTQDLRSASYWPSYNVFRVGVADSLGDTRIAIDPLTGISTLEDAYTRAAALGASGSDRAHLAWAILLANADAATSGRGPLLAWIVASATGNTLHPWEELLQKVAASTWQTIIGSPKSDGGAAGYAIPPTEGGARPPSTGRVLPEIADQIAPADFHGIMHTAKRYLTPWVEELLMAHQLRFKTVSADGNPVIAWQADTFDIAKAGPGKHPARRLWYYDDSILKALPTILDSQQVPNLVVQMDKLSATGSGAPEYIWCPVGGSNRFAIVQRRGADTWIPVQLY